MSGLEISTKKKDVYSIDCNLFIGLVIELACLARRY